MSSLDVIEIGVSFPAELKFTKDEISDLNKTFKASVANVLKSKFENDPPPFKIINNTPPPTGGGTRARKGSRGGVAE